ncbi:hypothetical protein [Microbulbifer sp. JMSA003]|uniref:hypothetical protein n=1 Tax=Microbulbifer sp. JMSA003 TaxID=3243369 RepID=UPI0040399AFD
MVIKSALNSNEKNFIDFVHACVKYCANGNIEEAFSILDKPVSPDRHHWSPEDIKEIIFDHFDDGKQPVISSPDSVEETIRKDIFTYDDGFGSGVEYDLPLNGAVSDFMLMFDFIKVRGQILIILDDCYLM